MYALANRLELKDIEASARLVYAECLEAGYTAVGEFHYLHHPGGTADSGLGSASAIIRAARQTGIRLRLLFTVYSRGGFGQPLRDEQRRFETPSLADVERALDGIAKTLLPSDAGRLGLGLAIHSVRAVEDSWFGPIAELAREREIPLHVHASEQRVEVETCRAHFGLSPIALLDERGALGPETSLVHATWCDDEDLDRIARSGATVVICPTTEGDLGDGVPRTAAMWARRIPIAIGSDSHAIIDPFAELRRLEYDARAASESRCVLVDARGEALESLIAIGSTAGRRSLGFSETDHGDRVRLRADARFFAGIAPGDRAVAALLGAHPGLVDEVQVGGEVLVVNGRHAHV